MSQGRDAVYISRSREALCLLNAIDAHLLMHFPDHSDAIYFREMCMEQKEVARACGTNKECSEVLQDLLRAYMVLERILHFDSLILFFRTGGYRFIEAFARDWKHIYDEGCDQGYREEDLNTFSARAQPFLKVLEIDARVEDLALIAPEDRFNDLSVFLEAWRKALVHLRESEAFDLGARDLLHFESESALFYRAYYAADESVHGDTPEVDFDLV